MCPVAAARISGSNFVRLTSRSQHNAHSTEMAENLTPREIEKVEFAFSIYDADGSNVVDCADLGNVLRALNLNPTNATIEKVGGGTKRGEKKLTLEEFMPIYLQVKDDKDQGGYEDFLECLKLYDKAENGMMLAAELSNMLLTVGEKLEDADVNLILGECMDPEDEDGFIPYAPFLRRMCDKASEEQ